MRLLREPAAAWAAWMPEGLREGASDAARLEVRRTTDAALLRRAALAAAAFCARNGAAASSLAFSDSRLCVNVG